MAFLVLAEGAASGPGRMRVPQKITMLRTDPEPARVEPHLLTLPTPHTQCGLTKSEPIPAFSLDFQLFSLSPAFNHKVLFSDGQPIFPLLTRLLTAGSPCSEEPFQPEPEGPCRRWITAPDSQHKLPHALPSKPGQDVSP